MQSCYKKQNPFVGFPRPLIKDLIIRSLNGQITFALMNVAMTLLPMSTAMILFQMNPFWIAILACIMLGERIRLVEILGIVVCFGGVVIIALSKAEEVDDEKEKEKLEAELGEENAAEDGSEDEPSELDKYLGVIIAITAAFTFALTSVFNRKLKAIDYTALMVYHGIIGGILASTVILIEGAIKGSFRFYTPW